MREFVPGKVTWLHKTNEVPFSGAIDHEALINLAKKIGDTRWRPPKNTLGGSELAIVKTTRNELAHGESSFESVGSNYSIQDISDKVERIQKFMVSYISMMARYRDRGHYLRH